MLLELGYVDPVGSVMKGFVLAASMADGQSEMGCSEVFMSSSLGELQIVKILLRGNARIVIIIVNDVLISRQLWQQGDQLYLVAHHSKRA